eukprot:Rhum_TRINITY_DN14894_c15_g1::Rhum_TRINITY_DN14894_c15_g1_i1::g.126135::m.126135
MCADIDYVNLPCGFLRNVCHALEPLQTKAKEDRTHTASALSESTPCLHSRGGGIGVRAEVESNDFEREHVLRVEPSPELVSDLGEGETLLVVELGVLGTLDFVTLVVVLLTPLEDVLGVDAARVLLWDALCRDHVHDKVHPAVVRRSLLLLHLVDVHVQLRRARGVDVDLLVELQRERVVPATRRRRGGHQKLQRDRHPTNEHVSRATRCHRLRDAGVETWPGRGGGGVAVAAGDRQRNVAAARRLLLALLLHLQVVDLGLQLLRLAEVVCRHRFAQRLLQLLHRRALLTHLPLHGLDLVGDALRLRKVAADNRLVLGSLHLLDREAARYRNVLHGAQHRALGNGARRLLEHLVEALLADKGARRLDEVAPFHALQPLLRGGLRVVQQVLHRLAVERAVARHARRLREARVLVQVKKLLEVCNLCLGGVKVLAQLVRHVGLHAARNRLPQLGLRVQQLLVLLAQAGVLRLDLLQLLQKRLARALRHLLGHLPCAHLCLALRLRELLLQRHDLLLEQLVHLALLAQLQRTRHPVLFRGVGDQLGVRRVVERRLRLYHVVRRRRAGGDHPRLRVSSERVLEQTGQHGVAEGDVCLRSGLTKGVDGTSQHEQGFVDVLGLVQGLALGARLALTLGSREIDDEELRLRVGLLGVGRVVAYLRFEHHDRVRPRRHLVHLRGGNLPPGVAHQKVLHHLLGADALLPRHARDERLALRVLAHSQVLVALHQQVAHLLVVDFYVAHLHRGVGRRVFLAHLTHLLVQVLRHTRRETLVLVDVVVLVLAHASARQSLDGVRLARPGLAVREERDVVAVEALIHHGLSHLHEDVALVCGRREDGVEGVRLVALLAIGVLADELAELIVDGHSCAVVAAVRRRVRTSTDAHLHAVGPRSRLPFGWHFLECAQFNEVQIL